MIRTAILSSPTTSPAKENQFLANFREEEKRFDFDTKSKWSKIFVDMDDPEYEFLDL
jgi:hypothetical protein